MLSEKVKVYCRGDDRDCLISQATVRRCNTQITSVQLNISQGDWIEKGQELGKVICSDGSEKVIKFNLRGTIDQINQNMDFNAPSFNLFTINFCGHDEVNQSEHQHLYFCSKCSEEVLIYRDKSVGIIVAKNLSDFISSKRLEHKEEKYDIKFGTIKKNEVKQPKTVLFEAELNYENNQSDSESEDESEKIQFKLDEIIYIKDINYNYNKDRSWILKYEKIICSHQKIDQNNICVFCYSDVPRHSNKVYAGLDEKDKSVLIGKEYAEYSKKLAHQQLHSNQKLILVLDLDNTILHAVPSMNSALFDNAEGIQKDSFQEFHNKYNKYVIKFRPYMKEFLQTVLPHYEIYIFTMAMLDYAKCVCDYLKTTYKDILGDYPKTFDYDRIISREKFTSSNKDLQQILPNSEKVMLILDDRDDVWSKNKMNLVTTLPYIYWWEGSESFNEQAFKAIDQVYSNKFKYLRSLNKNQKKQIKPESQTTDGKNNNSETSKDENETKQKDESMTQSNGNSSNNKDNIQEQKESEKIQNNTSENQENASVENTLENQKQEQSIEGVEEQPKLIEIEDQNGNQEQNNEIEEPKENNQSDNKFNENSSFEEDTKDQSSQSETEKSLNEEKMDLEVQEQNQLSDQNEQQANQEYPSFNHRESEMDLQIENAQQEEESKSSNEKKDEQKSEESQNPQARHRILLDEKKLRPKYKEQILSQYDNENFWKTNQSLQYKLTVIKKTDNYLLFVAPILVHLKNKYYEQTDQTKRDIRDTFSYYVSQILKGVKIAVSSIIRKDKNETAENNIVCLRFKKMGGTLFEKLKATEQIDYFVIGSSPRKDKVAKAIQNNIPIISYKWIEYCWYYNYKLDVSIFEVNKTDLSFKKNDQQIQQELFDKYQNLISI